MRYFALTIFLLLAAGACFFIFEEKIAVPAALALMVAARVADEYGERHTRRGRRASDPS